MIKSSSRGKNIATMIRKTAQNKIRHIKRELKVAKGRAIKILEDRLKFWETKQ